MLAYNRFRPRQRRIEADLEALRATCASCCRYRPAQLDGHAMAFGRLERAQGPRQPMSDINVTRWWT